MCGAAQKSKCAPCSGRYRRRVQRVVRDGMSLSPFGQTLTVTGPGERQHCRRHKNCGGQGLACDICPCTLVGGISIGVWNCSVTARLNRLFEAIKRGEASPLQHGRRVPVPLAYFSGREAQQRGALHAHIPLVRTDGKALKLSPRLLKRLVMKHGFGHSMTLKDNGGDDGPIPGYVAKYVTDSADARADVPWVDSKGWRAKATYRTWSSSRSWGQTMKGVKAAQRSEWLQRHDPSAGEPEAIQPIYAFSASYATDLVVTAFPGCSVGRLTMEGVEYGGAGPPAVEVVAAMATQLIFSLTGSG